MSVNRKEIHFKWTKSCTVDRVCTARNTSHLKSVSLHDRYKFHGLQTDHPEPPNHEVAHSPLQRLHLKPTRPQRKVVELLRQRWRETIQKSCSQSPHVEKKKGAPWIKIQAVLVAFLLFDLTWSPAWYLGHTTGYTSKSVVSSRHHQCVTCDMHCDMHVIAIHGNLPGCWPPPANHDAYWETSPLTFTDWNSSFYIYLNTYP